MLRPQAMFLRIQKMSKDQKKKLPLISRILLAISAFFLVLAVFYHVKAYFGG